MIRIQSFYRFILVLMIVVTCHKENNPPDISTTPSGPSSGFVDSIYTFYSSTVDPDGDDIAIRFSWGDGDISSWSSYVSSGSTVSASHSWSSAGTYNITAQAKDINGVNSEWSSSHSIVISADGGSENEVVFFSNRCGPGNYEIHTMHSDGSNVVRITNNSYIEYSPRWSVNRAKIVFYSHRNGNANIYIINPDGTNEQQLTFNSNNSCPSWSRDGTKICFNSDRDGNREVYVMNSDGSNHQRITYDNADDYGSDWSPDGSRIVFASNRGGPGYAIYIMNADGSNVQHLTDGGSSPSWSPDGLRITFTLNHGGYNWEIYVINIDGTGLTRLTNTASNIADASPRWSPDGSKIIFNSNLDGNDGIWIMNADGSNPYCISHYGFKPQDADPDWR